MEDFAPAAEVAGLYSCGPTVYAYPHLGNMRAYVFADTLRRALRWKGLGVRHVVNITDVFLVDTAALNILPADEYPRASAYVEQMIEFAKKLDSDGFTYQLPSGLYFDTSKDPHYGEL